MTENPEIIDSQSRLDEECRRLKRAGVFAFDTEFIRDDTFDAKLCLVQVACGDHVVLIDPTAQLDIGAFWKLVHDPKILKIVHAGKEDFEVCTRSTGAPPRNVFDVQIAAGFLGHGYPLSLVRLAGLIVHKRLSKAQTLTDWLRRPLTEEQLRYAADDVAYLPAIHATLAADLAARGRVAWAEEEFRRFEDAQLYRPPPTERLQRFKGTRNMDGLGLLVLERLIEWREAWAREKNRPIRAMMRDDILVEIARRRPTRADQLEVMRGFPQARNPRIIGQILKIIEDARATPKKELPAKAEVREESPHTRVATDVLSAFARATCLAESLDMDLVGGAQRIRELLDYLRDGGAANAASNGQRPALLQGWREAFLGKRMVELLEGRCELHLSGWPDELRLDVVSHRRARTKAVPDATPAAE